MKRQATLEQRDYELRVRSAELNDEDREVEGDDQATVLSFGRYLVLPRARKLLADGQPVEIGSRAFDLLIVLLRARGTLVTKDELIERVWPSTIVDRSNLRVQMVALRKVLGSDRDFIKTIPGRGYIFAADSSIASIAAPRGASRPPWAVPSRRPVTHASGGQGPGCEPIASCEGTEPIVVVIDDDRDVREALDGLIRSVGFRVELFSSVQEFLTTPRSAIPGCLVLDVWLPGRSGLDFHADLAKANVHLPVIFISGHADVPMSVRAMKAGAVEFLTKPVRHQDLLDAIRLAIGPRGGVDAGAEMN